MIWVITECADQNGQNCYDQTYPQGGAVDATLNGEEEVLYIHNYWLEPVTFYIVADSWDETCGLFDLEISEVMM